MADATPWPDVPECYGIHRDGPPCSQCDGSHRHEWAALVRQHFTGNYRTIMTRCSVCGGRKCDVPGCIERRHHMGPHLDPVSGSIRPVGS